jgi:excisionase family DNA binding protein
MTSEQPAWLSKSYLYRHFDENGQLLYVGISLGAIERLRQHSFGSDWFDEIRTITMETFETRAEALEAERKAIKKENPKHNVIHKGPELVRNTRHGLTKDDLSKSIYLKPLYTLKEVAQLLRMTELWVQSLMNDGKLGFVECGRRRYITGWQVIAFMEWWESSISLEPASGRSVKRSDPYDDSGPDAAMESEAK